MKQHPLTNSNIVGLGAIGQALRPLIPEDLPVLFFCVKAFDLEAALRQYADRRAPEIPFITLCNGAVAPVIASCRDVLGARPVRLGMTTMGAAFGEDGLLKVQAEGAITAWGGYAESPQTITPAEEQLIASHPGWRWYDDMNPVIAKKWIFNTVLNTLSGALKLSSNGKLLHHRSLAESLFSEAFRLAAEIWPDATRGFKETELLAEFWLLVDRTRNNENSMARDVRLGRRTEGAYLAGLARDYRGYDKLKTYHAVLARFDRAP